MEVFIYDPKNLQNSTLPDRLVEEWTKMRLDSRGFNPLLVKSSIIAEAPLSADYD